MAGRKHELAADFEVPVIASHAVVGVDGTLGVVFKFVTVKDVAAALVCSGRAGLFGHGIIEIFEQTGDADALAAPKILEEVEAELEGILCRAVGGCAVGVFIAKIRVAQIHGVAGGSILRRFDADGGGDGLAYLLGVSVGLVVDGRI